MSKCVHFIRFVNRDEPSMSLWIEFGAQLYTIESIRSLKIYLCHRLEQYFPNHSTHFSPFHLRLIGIESINFPDSHMKCQFTSQTILIQPTFVNQPIEKPKSMPMLVLFYFSPETKYIATPTSLETIPTIEYLLH